MYESGYGCFYCCDECDDGPGVAMFVQGLPDGKVIKSFDCILDKQWQLKLQVILNFVSSESHDDMNVCILLLFFCRRT